MANFEWIKILILQLSKLKAYILFLWSMKMFLSLLKRKLSVCNLKFILQSTLLCDISFEGSTITKNVRNLFFNIPSQNVWLSNLTSCGPCTHYLCTSKMTRILANLSIILFYLALFKISIIQKDLTIKNLNPFLCR